MIAPLLSISAAEVAIDPEIAINPGIYTYAQIAEKIGLPNAPVKCDSDSADRAAFVFVRSMPREELVAGLGMRLVDGGSRLLMKRATTADEKRWVVAVQGALQSEMLKFVRFGVAYSDAHPIPADSEISEADAFEQPWPEMKIEAGMPAARELQNVEEMYKIQAERTVSYPDGAAAIRIANDVSPAVTDELFINGVDNLTLPLQRLSPASQKALLRAHRTLQFHPQSVALLHRELQLFAGATLKTDLYVIDPGFSGRVGSMQVSVPSFFGSDPSLSQVERLLRMEEGKGIKLPNFRATVQTETPELVAGRARLVELLRHKSEDPYALLSRQAASWAAQGQQLVVELVPGQEMVPAAAQVQAHPDLLKRWDMQPTLNGDVLVLKSQFRFLSERRHFPMPALLALETATSEKGMSVQHYRIPPAGAMTAYLRSSSPSVRWGGADFGGWSGRSLDSLARARRLGALIPKEALRAIRSGQKSWRADLTQLPITTLETLALEMREFADPRDGSTIAWSPAAFELFVRTGNVVVQPRGEEIQITFNSDPKSPLERVMIMGSQPL